MPPNGNGMKTYNAGDDFEISGMTLIKVDTINFVISNIKSTNNRLTMKELIERNKKIVFAINIIIAFIAFTKFKLESSTIEGHIGSFVGYNIMLLLCDL